MGKLFTAVIGFLIYWAILFGLNVWFIQPMAAGTWNGPNIDLTYNAYNDTLGSVPGTTWVGLGFFELLLTSGPKLLTIFSFMVFGLGLPADTPTWFSWLFSITILIINIIFATMIIFFLKGGDN